MTDIYEQLRNAKTAKEANALYDYHHSKIDEMMLYLENMQDALDSAYADGQVKRHSERTPIKESVLSPSAQLQIDSQYQECKLVGGCD